MCLMLFVLRVRFPKCKGNSFKKFNMKILSTTSEVIEQTVKRASTLKYYVRDLKEKDIIINNGKILV